MHKLIGTCLLLALAACSRGSGASVDVVLPDGSKAVLITCQTRSDCLVAVSASCPKGWFTSDKEMSDLEDFSYMPAKNSKTFIAQCKN